MIATGRRRRAAALPWCAAALIAACVPRTDEPAATRELGTVVSAVPCVSGHDLTYNDQPNASGAISGRVQVPDRACFETVLQALAGMRDFNHSRATVMYLTGQLPDGKAVLPEDFGFHPRPTLQAVREKYRPAR